MSNSPSICYLCDRPLAPPLSQDHVPPKQVYADAIRNKHNPNLLTITVHKGCNLAYQFDEDYFVNTIAPFARGSYSGNVLLHEIFQKYHSGKKRGLVHKVYQSSSAGRAALSCLAGWSRSGSKVSEYTVSRGRSSEASISSAFCYPCWAFVRPAFGTQMLTRRDLGKLFEGFVAEASY